VLWIPVDPVTLESGTMLYVRGSHRDGKLYQPNVFIAQTPLPGAQGEPLPDIEGHMDDYDIIHFDVEPGDVIVHHYRTIHGAGGNHSRYHYIRDMAREMAKMADGASMHFLNYLLFLVVEEANNLSNSELAKDPEEYS